ncbi:hypothetical protein CEUSTIGMA_g6129.t1 [Chlamydomonas eustigma]|uniref:(S)-ureidoglycine aminohydrolase cupin domain-containing protein n=1 Tax=Chlamydomonas eustigma TaxID=1157962 RepID=A0A250X6I0_9CHLO|nr:hypothetical protein CEUSTIGMA_g6129.t1 [Chlamydomonas eustigma]|eukprot:GAX78691.1 hypothetical protein CEUSTIGMA_g6129.t1 [Chlamydomonas eustigma]
MPKKKVVDSDEEEELDEEELHQVQSGRATKVSARPRRAAAAAVQKLTQKLIDGDDEDEDGEEELVEIPKAALTKYKTDINAEPNTVHVIKKDDINPAMLKALLVDEWPTWASKTGGWPDLNVPYEYEHRLRELSLVLEGSATVTIPGGKAVEIHTGDFAVFPKKLVCTWVITEPLKKKYYEFSR